MSSLRSNTPDPDDPSDSISGTAVDIQDCFRGFLTLFSVVDSSLIVDLHLLGHLSAVFCTVKFFIN